MSCVSVVAEIGLSHCGVESELYNLIDELDSIGITHIKLQVFNFHPVLSRKLEDFLLPKPVLKKLTGRYPHLHIGASVFCQDDARFVHGDMGCDFIKIPSGRGFNTKLLNLVRGFDDCERQLSTGMMDHEEVYQAVKSLKPHVIYHCVSQYPPPKCAASLNTIENLWEDYKAEIGWSDHYPGINMCIAAAACGAWVIEKHYGTAGPDKHIAADKFEMCALLDALDGLRDAVDAKRVLTDSEVSLKEQILEMDRGVK